MPQTNTIHGSLFLYIQFVHYCRKNTHKNSKTNEHIVCRVVSFEDVEDLSEGLVFNGKLRVEFVLYCVFTRCLLDLQVLNALDVKIRATIHQILDHKSSPSTWKRPENLTLLEHIYLR